jgi:hypothetical protein
MGPAAQDCGGWPLDVGTKVAFAIVTYRRAELRIGTVVAIDLSRPYGETVQVLNPVSNRREWRKAKLLARTFA